MIILLFMQLLIPRYPFPWLFASYLSFDLDSKFLSHCSSLLFLWDFRSPIFSHTDHAWRTRVCFSLMKLHFKMQLTCLSPTFQSSPRTEPASYLPGGALWTPLLLCPSSQPQSNHFAPARFLPSTCLQSFTASSNTDPCTNQPPFLLRRYLLSG